MSQFSTAMVREFLVDFLEERLTLRGYSAAQVNDDFDLLASGAIDSLAFMEMIVALQEQFDVELDFGEVDPVQLSVIGPLCHYISSLKLKRLSTGKM